MYKAFEIAGLWIKQLVRERTTFIFLLGLPLIFTLLTGAMWGSSGSGAIPLVIVDNDESAYSAALTSGLGVTDTFELVDASEQDARNSVDDQKAAAAIIIPAGFGERIVKNRDVSVEFIRSKRQTSPSVAYQALQRSLARLKGSAVAADVTVKMLGDAGLLDETERNQAFSDAFSSADKLWSDEQPAYTLYSEMEGHEEEFSGSIGYSSAGFTTMFVMMGLVMAASSFLDERRQGTLARLLTAPVNKASIMGGKLLGIFLEGLLQVAILISASYFLFGVNWGQHPLALLVLVASFLLASTGLGVLIASLVRTGAQARAIGSFVVLIASMLGGTWWPLELVPQTMQRIALAVPTTWAMQGFHNLVDRGLGLDAVLPQAAVLLGFALVFFAVGIKSFRYQ